MNSKNNRVSKNSSVPKQRAPYKFILRNLQTFNNFLTSFQQVRVKRLYLRKMMDERERETDSKEILYKPFKSNKVFKTLKRVQLSSYLHPYAQESLKNSKRIKEFRLCSFTDETNMNKIALCIKRLPATVEILRVNAVKRDQVIMTKNFYNIAKSIRRLPKLQNFHRWLLLETARKRNHVTKELRFYDQSISRLKGMKKFMYSLGHNEIFCLQRTMRKGEVYPKISGLKMFFTADEVPDYNLLDPFFEAEESQNTDESFDFEDMDETEEKFYNKIARRIRKEDAWMEDDSKNRAYQNQGDNSDTDSVSSFSSQPDRQFLINCIMRQDITPFFRFELFPNLKRLGIIQEEYMYPLSSFVIDGFAALQKLEHLTIDLLERSLGTFYIFEGLLKLPLLKKFSFKISFIKIKEWKILEKFLKSQNNLKCLTLIMRSKASTRSHYLKQSIHLENIIKDLQNKPRLKSLQFRSDYWSLETLSKGFAHLTMLNQLESLRIEASDETITSDLRHWKRIEGLCNFIKNQKGSLIRLHLFLPLALDADIVNHLSEAISRLTNLRILLFAVNQCLLQNLKTLSAYFETTLQVDIPFESQKELIESDPWKPNIAKYIKKLCNLQDFTLIFNMRELQGTEPYRWFIDIMKALPSLKTLRRISVTCDAGAASHRDIEEKLSAAVRELKYVTSVDINFYDPSDFFVPRYPILRQALTKVNEKQAKRCDLMF